MQPCSGPFDQRHLVMISDSRESGALYSLHGMRQEEGPGID